ncbi:MAG: hypothetical protein MJ025_05120 [Victivallaceae bacterium]|nr:hypothetical protein [Victivallaceae bacterium]
MGKSVEDVLSESNGVSWHEYLSADRSADEKALYLDSLALVIRNATEAQKRYVNALGDYAGVSNAGSRVAGLSADASKIHAKDALKMLSDQDIPMCWVIDAAFVASLDPQQDAAEAVVKALYGTIGEDVKCYFDDIEDAVTVATGDIDGQMVELVFFLDSQLTRAWRTIVDYRRLSFDPIIEQLSEEFSKLEQYLYMVQIEMATKGLDVFHCNLKMGEGFARKLGGIRRRIVKSKLEDVKKKYEDVYDKCEQRIKLARCLFSLFGLEFNPYVNSASGIEFDGDSSSDNDNWSKNNEMAVDELMQLAGGLKSAMEKADKLLEKIVHMSCCPPPTPDADGAMLEWSEITGMPSCFDVFPFIVAAFDRWFVAHDEFGFGAVYSTADGKEWIEEKDVPKGKLVSAGGLLFSIDGKECHVKEAASAPWRRLELPETKAGLRTILHVGGKWFLYYEEYAEYNYVRHGLIIDHHETGYATHGRLFVAEKLDGKWSAGPELPEAAALDYFSAGVVLGCLENRLVGKLTFDCDYKNATGKKYLRDAVFVAGGDGFKRDCDSSYSSDPLPDSGHLIQREGSLLYVTDHTVHRSDDGSYWQRVEGVEGVSIGIALFLSDGNVATFKLHGDDCRLTGIDGSIRRCGNDNKDLGIDSAAANGNRILAAAMDRLFVGTLKVREA